MRALRGHDARSARSLIDGAFDGTRYHERMHELLANALRFDDDEHLGLVGAATDEPDPRALALYGTVAGASGVTRLHALVDDGRSTDAAVLRSILNASVHARMLVCELPDDAPFAHAARTLATVGFAEEGRVGDLVADGVAMRLLVCRPRGDRPSRC